MEVPLPNAYIIFSQILDVWSQMLICCDVQTVDHSTHSAETALALAEACGIRGEALDDFYRGALLHDIGKIAIPDRILRKPAPLDTQEWETMRTHPQKAVEILADAPALDGPALAIPRCHHEWWDGSGYPLGLKREEIPLEARIFAVVDVYDALTENRPYRKAWPEEKAIAYILDQSGKQFDPQVVEQFLKIIQRRP